jgi:hypothetical protein
VWFAAPRRRQRASEAAINRRFSVPEQADGKRGCGEHNQLA